MSVIRRKIDAASGVPPTVLSALAFWAELTASVGTWVGTTTGLPLVTDILRRKVVKGREVTARPNEFLWAGFQPGFAQGLCAIGVDRHLMTIIAAHNLNQPVEAAGELPDLFLNLLAKSAAMSLWRNIVSGFPAGSASAAQASPAAADIVVAIEDDARYLSVTWQVTGDAGQGHVAILFDRHFLLAVNKLASRSTSSPTRESEARPSAWRERVKQSQIELGVVVERRQMTIAECSSLEEGTVIVLDGAERRDLSLSVLTINGAVDIAQGHAGTRNSFRALKLSTPVSEEFLRHL